MSPSAPNPPMNYILFGQFQDVFIKGSSVTRVVKTAFLGLDGSVLHAMTLTFVLCATMPGSTVWITGSLALTAVTVEEGTYFTRVPIGLYVSWQECIAEERENQT